MEIHLADSTSKLFLLDILSCGRAVRGERFAYRRFGSKVQIYRGGKLVYRDNTRYEPEKMPMESLGMYEGYSHMPNIFLSGCVDEDAAFDRGKTSELQGKIWEFLEAEKDCDGGVSMLVSGDLAVRVFGNRAQVLQEIAEKIKALF
jgi:urease accessory protein